MSASREKKIRQELAAQGIPDIKEIRAAEERKQQRRANILYGSLAAIFVLVAAALLVWNSNIIQRSSVAISVDGEKFTAAEVNYYYSSAVNNMLSSQYAGYLSLDSSKPLNQQVMADMDFMFTGATLPEGKEELTWHEYFLDLTKKQMVELTGMLNAAEEDGFTFTDEMQTQLDETLASMEEYARLSGVTLSSYIKSMFGASMTEKVLVDMLKDAMIVAAFQEQHWNELTYTTDDLTAYYNENAQEFDLANYEYIYFRGTALSTTDANGNTVAATDAENAAAEAKAKAAAEDVLAQYKAGGDLQELAAKYEDIASYYNQEGVSYSGGAVQDWVFDSARKADDVDVINSGSTYYVALFHSRERNDYNPVNVRHILCSIDESGLNSEDAGYADARQMLIDMAKAEAEGLLAEYEAGAKTAESFGELAGKNSDDSGSVGNGGLYNNVGKGEMVDPFDQWIYDENRKPGDTGIVFVDMETSYTGYHVMYFEGVTETPYWQLQVESTMRNNDYNEWYASLSEGLTAEEHSGTKFVG